jgi:hypothetical protein
MRLKDFIRTERERILQEWEAFASTCEPVPHTIVWADLRVGPGGAHPQGAARSRAACAVGKSLCAARACLHRRSLPAGALRASRRWTR